MNLTLPDSLPLNQLLLWGLGALIVITGISVATEWHSDWVLAHQPVGVVAHTTDASDKAMAALPKAHLFGQALMADGNLPITNLQCRVTSIIKVINAHGDDASRAIITINGDAGKVYQVGDALPDGVKIYQINANAVVLENEGRLEKLPLPRTQLVFKAPNTEDNFS